MRQHVRIWKFVNAAPEVNWSMVEAEEATCWVEKPEEVKNKGQDIERFATYNAPDGLS